MSRKKTLVFAFSALALLSLAATLAFFFFRRSKIDTGPTAEFRSAAVMISSACIAAVEKPSAVKVLLCGEESSEFRGIFESFGYLCTQSEEMDGISRFDIVFVTGEPSAKELSSYSERMSESGVLAWRIDVGGMDCSRFRKLVSQHPCPSIHFWMPGEEEWLLVGRMDERAIKADAMMEVFAREGAFDILADARAFALSDMFASYVGTRETIEGAFALGTPKTEVRPEFFVTKDVPEIAWVVKGAVDDDIFTAFRNEIRSLQSVRRQILEGNMALRRGEADAALEIWAEAARKNPRDPMLQERLGRLTLNANALLRIGNPAAAAKCFETIIVIDPSNASAVFEYGKCLQMLGKKELAAQVLKKAKELAK